jgi:hypothetical protein
MDITEYRGASINLLALRHQRLSHLTAQSQQFGSVRLTTV